MKKTPVSTAGAGAAISSTSTIAISEIPAPSERVLDGFRSTAERFLAAAQSDATKRAYALDLRHFLANGGRIPCSPTELADYLARCAEKNAVATLQRRLTTIHKVHIEKNLPSPVRNDLVRRAMQGIRRTLGTKQRQVRPLVKDALLEALVMLDKQRPVKAARDRALLLVGFGSAMRRSELVALRVEHITNHDQGIEIEIPMSKTDQTRAGRAVFIPHANGLRCPIQALAQWLKIAQIADGHVFRAVNRHDQVSPNALTPQSVALVVKAAVERLGGNVDDVSGHSLRAGYCTSAAEKGLQSWQIREQTGHKSDVTLAKYIRPVARRKIPSLL